MSGDNGVGVQCVCGGVKKTEIKGERRGNSRNKTNILGATVISLK